MSKVHRAKAHSRRLRNTASRKHTRDFLLKNCWASATKPDLPEAFAGVVSDVALKPALQPGTRATLSPRLVRPRNLRVKERLPEWFAEEAPLPHVKSSRYSDSNGSPVTAAGSLWEDATDELFDFGRSKEELDSSPTSVSEKNKVLLSYDLRLLQYHRALGSPFASTLLEHGQLVDGAVQLLPFSKPYERLWSYKDSAGQIHGPFSTIDMFNWTIRGYFPANLEISLGLVGYFVPMNMFGPFGFDPHMFGCPPKTDKAATAALKTLLGF